MEKTKQISIARTILMVVICFALMVTFTVAPVSAASYTVKNVHGKTSITISNGQSAISCSAKVAKKGQTCSLEPLKRTTVKAKTLYYGKSKGWSNAKISKALKKGKRYKIKVPNTWSFANVKVKGKTIYVAYTAKKATPSQPSSATQPAPASSNESATTGTIAVDIASTDSSYNTEAYSLEGQLVTISGENGAYRVAANKNGDVEIAVDAGTYRVEILTPVQDDTPVYMFSNCTDEATVQAGETVTVEIKAEPVPCRFYALCSEDPEEVTLHCEETGKDITLESKDTFEMSPFEADIPAGDYTVSAGNIQQKVRTAPGWFCTEL